MLPNVSDGRLEAQVRKAAGAEVGMQTTVEDKGKEPVKIEGKVKADTTGQGSTSVDLNRTADGKTSVKQSSGKKP